MVQYLFADAVSAHKLLGNAHRVAVQQFGQESAQRGTIGKWQEARLMW